MKGLAEKCSWLGIEVCMWMAGEYECVLLDSQA